MTERYVFISEIYAKNKFPFRTLIDLCTLPMIPRVGIMAILVNLRFIAASLEVSLGLSQY